MLCFAWGEVKAVGWSEIQARAIRENLYLPFHGALLVGWEPPREARNLFPIYRQFLHYELSSHIHLTPPLISTDFPPVSGKSRSRGKFGRQCQLLVTNFSPLTFDLLVTNGHSSEQGSMWDHGQPDDCVCETFCAARTPSFQEAVSKRALIRLLLPFRETFLFVDDTKTLHPQFLLAQCQLWWAIVGNGHWAMNNGQLGIWHIVANCR